MTRRVELCIADEAAFVFNLEPVNSVFTSVGWLGL